MGKPENRRPLESSGRAGGRSILRALLIAIGLIFSSILAFLVKATFLPSLWTQVASVLTGPEKKGGVEKKN